MRAALAARVLDDFEDPVDGAPIERSDSICRIRRHSIACLDRLLV